MSAIHSIKDLKKQSNAGKVSIIALLILPLIGLTCLLMPHLVTDYLPYALGGIMTLSGLGGIIVVARGKDADADTRSAGTSIVMCILGIVILVHGESSISFIGVMWGLLGLFKAGREFDKVIHLIKTKKRCLVKLAFTIFKLVLSVLLILNPFANIDHHVIILGLELISYPFTIDRAETGRFTVEADGA